MKGIWTLLSEDERALVDRVARAEAAQRISGYTWEQLCDETQTLFRLAALNVGWECVS